MLLVPVSHKRIESGESWSTDWERFGVFCCSCGWLCADGNIGGIAGTGGPIAPRSSQVPWGVSTKFSPITIDAGAWKQRAPHGDGLQKAGLDIRSCVDARTRPRLSTDTQLLCPEAAVTMWCHLECRKQNVKYFLSQLPDVSKVRWIWLRA